MLNTNFSGIIFFYSDTFEEDLRDMPDKNYNIRELIDISKVLNYELEILIEESKILRQQSRELRELSKSIIKQRQNYRSRFNLRELLE